MKFTCALLLSLALSGLTYIQAQDLPPIFRPAPQEEGPPQPDPNAEPLAPPEMEGPPRPPEVKPDPILNPQKPVNMPEYLPAKDTGPKTTGPGFVDAWDTTAGAKILVLSIPAPRGQIVDRNGAPLAQNRVVYYLGVKFPLLKDESDEQVLSYARSRIAQANSAMGTDWSLEDDVILAHYQKRRWIPLIFSYLPLTDEQRDKIEVMGAEGLELHPTYQRFYPQGTTAGHIIGFVGNRGPWPKGEIPDGEAMWPTAEGVRGLEKSFDKQLTGTPGRVQIIYDENGKQVEKTVIRNPVPGENVVTTLDLDMQNLAETTVAAKVKRGAFVIMDVRNGDVLAMASYPNFNPNDYVPRISVKRYKELNEDPAKPLYGRAFQAAYPPASTFKLVSGLGILESGRVDEYSIFGCPTSFSVGNRIAHNWAKVDEGPMNIIGAITRSCNTWFYQSAIEAGASNVTLAGVKLGFGQRSGCGLPESEEVAGFMPTNEWFREEYGHPILDGDLINISIGQGHVSATPLQVCQAMAAIGNRQYLHKARLVMQTQDYANRVTGINPKKIPLSFSQHNLAVIHKGMYDVINAGNGTGRAAGHSRVNFTGKTGTGQWIPTKDQNIAWFSGFAPAEFPVYAYAAVYEGDPGETVSGGSKGAPIIGEFFKEYLTEDRLIALQALSDEIRVATAHMVVETEDLGTGGIFEGPTPTGEETPVPAERTRKPPRSNGGGNFFKRLFGN